MTVAAWIIGTFERAGTGTNMSARRTGLP
jgi:hypothetical protein